MDGREVTVVGKYLPEYGDTVMGIPGKAIPLIGGGITCIPEQNALSSGIPGMCRAIHSLFVFFYPSSITTCCFWPWITDACLDTSSKRYKHCPPIRSDSH